ncbi:MAG: Fic family protein [Proteobacteria bacterium]|nr:Fic family protein [Pseudomonadota bacterium]
MSIQHPTLIDWVKQNRKSLHVIELAARLHHRLVQMHPFFDGNGKGKGPENF